MSQRTSPLNVGVVGVGSMGQHHARVYTSLPEANLVAVSDVDHMKATEVGEKYGVPAVDLGTLLEVADAVSIAVPTPYHYDTAMACLNANVAPLIEKPLVENLENGRRLRSAAKKADVPVQVGHIERFNPAVSTLKDIVTDLTVIGITADRLGPPPERAIDDSAVLDLMIHDVDIVLSLVDQEPVSVKSSGVQNNRYASALLTFDSGVMASLTASRLTQRKIRTLEITAEECLVELDYIDQSIEIHRRSVPEYVEQRGDVRFRHESIVERPHIPNDEPLRRELESFIHTVATDGEPEVSIDDGLRALEIAQRIEDGDVPERIQTEVSND